MLPNAWDVITARLIESAGFAAIATSSAGVAWALGYADGERISRGEMLAVVRRIASGASVPVTADMEAGYGPTPEAAAETARGVIAAGAVGLNLEDGTNDGRLVDVALQQDRIRAMREAGAAAGVPLVINARTDAFEVKDWSPSERLTAAVRRANAYHAAGADCLFVPHVSDAATIGRLAREIEGPFLRDDGRPVDPVHRAAVPGRAHPLTGSNELVYLCRSVNINAFGLIRLGGSDMSRNCTLKAVAILNPATPTDGSGRRA